MNTATKISNLVEDLNDALNALEAAQSELRMDVEGITDDTEIWVTVARLEADNDQLYALLEELGIPDQLSVTDLLAIKAAIAEALK